MSGIGSQIAKFGLPVVHVGGEPVPPPRPSLLRRIPVPSPIRAIAAGGERATMLVIAALMLVYLTGGLVLAINVNRGFLLNDAMALLAFGTILGGLALASWRGSMRRCRASAILMASRDTPRPARGCACPFCATISLALCSGDGR